MDKRYTFIFLIAAHLLFLQASRVAAQNDDGHDNHIEFIENKKQWPEQVQYKANIAGGAMFLEKSCFTFVFKDAEAIEKLMAFKHKESGTVAELTSSDFLIKHHAYKVNFLNAKEDVTVKGNEACAGYYNFFQGKDKNSWSSRVNAYQTAEYKGIYEKTDLLIKETDSHLKYEVILHPGSDPTKLQFQYEGADRVSLRGGNLIVETSVNKVEEMAPIAYQIIDAEKILVTCKFKLTDSTLTFDFPDGYDETAELIIDPTLIFSTYTGSIIDNWGFTATFDSYGNAYSGGIAFGTGYPSSTGAFQVNFGGGEYYANAGVDMDGCDIAIIKYDSSGTQRLWATYLGGSRNDLPHSMIVNTLGNLVVYGTTGSDNFPVTGGAYDNSFNGGDSIMYDYVITFSHGIDLYASILSEDGTQLVASTYVGGTMNDGMNYPSVLSHNYADGARGEVMTDENNNVYIVSTTNSVDFPITPGAAQTTAGGGGQDGVVIKMDANLSNMIWSSYLGGSGNDAAYGVVLDDDKNVYVTGGTTSPNFPVTPGTLHQAYLGGTSDGFVTQFSQNGNSILRSTYYGSDAYDQSYLIERDKDGNIYVFGQTMAAGSTLIYNAAWGTPNSGQFVSKMNPELNTLEWSTVFGTGSGVPNISPTAFLVDLCNKIYLSGWGGSLNGTGGTSGLPITTNAYQNTTDNNDYYLLIISDDASALVYATFFGSPSSYDHVDGGTSRFDNRGRIYQSVCAGCGSWDDFPTTPGAWSNTNNSPNCNNALFKFDFMLPLVIAEFDPPSVGCAPYNAFFNNESYTSGVAGSVFYNWNFGDGTSSILENPSHDYTASGIYNVTLIVSDTGTCNLADTITHQVVVLDNATDTLPSVNICNGDFSQIGLLPLPDTSLTYQWIPSANLSNDTISNPIADPVSTTNYLLLVSNGICVDSIFQTVNVSILTVDAGPDTTICSDSVLLSASSSGGATTFIWSSTPNFADTLNFPITNNSVYVAPVAATIYYVMASNQACSKKDSILVRISQMNISAGVTQSICAGDTVSISVVNMNPSNPLTYAWSPSSSIASDTALANIFVNPTDTTNFIVFATDTMGCMRTDTVVISVSNIDAHLMSDSVRCYGDCNGWAAISPDGGNDPYTFLWSNSSVSDSIGGLCATSYSVVITDSVGCNKNFSFEIYTPSALSIMLTDTNMVDCDSICDGFATVLVTGGTLSYQYLWVDGQTTLTADSLCAGNYSVTVTDHNGCTIVLPVEITDTSNFDADVDSLVPPLCYGFCDGWAFAAASGGVLPYEYHWDTGDTLTFTDSLCEGTHNLLVIEDGGCMRNLFFDLPEPSHVSVSNAIAVDPSCSNTCDGQLSVSGTGGTPPYEYLWSTGDTSTTVDNLCGDDYFITVTDSHQCPDTDTLTLVNPTPLILDVFATNVPCIEVCNGVATAFASGSTPPYVYEWSNGYNGNPATDLCPGTYIVTVTDDHLCDALDTVEVHDSTNFPLNIHTWADDSVIYNSQSTGLHTTWIPAYSYSWSPSGSLSNPAIHNPVASTSSTTMYIVIIEDSYGCTYTDTVIVTVLDVYCDESQIFIPNAFTPNNDNNNDVLYVRSNIMNEIYLAIYDRWGEKVFETTDMNQGWDGTFRGMQCDPGVFDYYLKVTCINDMKFEKKGNVTLIR